MPHFSVKAGKRLFCHVVNGTAVHFFGGLLQEIIKRDGEVYYLKNFLSSSEADSFMPLLTEELEWRQDQITLFGKTHPVPRLQAWYGTPEASYSYSKIQLKPIPFTASLEGLRERLKQQLALEFNGVLCNLYRKGSDYAAWHSDNEKELGRDPIIASLSLGEVRKFSLRHLGDGETIHLYPEAGSLILMKGALQHYWKHQLAKTARKVNPRINLTFRRILAFS